MDMNNIAEKIIDEFDDGEGFFREVKNVLNEVKIIEEEILNNFPDPNN